MYLGNIVYPKGENTRAEKGQNLKETGAFRRGPICPRLKETD